jgi:hypothetical protein
VRYHKPGSISFTQKEGNWETAMRQALCRKRGAGYFLPGGWGCLPAFISPNTGGYKGLMEAISVISCKTTFKKVLIIDRGMYIRMVFIRRAIILLIL